MRAEWQDCIVVMIDLIDVKKRAADGTASGLMRKFHQKTAGAVGSLSSIAHAYAWNDSVLLLSYLNQGDSSVEPAMREAEQLKRLIDTLCPSFAIAVRGQAFPMPASHISGSDSNSKVTVIEASSWAMANCFALEKELGKYRKGWYIDSRITNHIRTFKKAQRKKVGLLPTGTPRNIYLFDKYLWDEKSD